MFVEFFQSITFNEQTFDTGVIKEFQSVICFQKMATVATGVQCQ
jgi:hypothetical protein